MSQNFIKKVCQTADIEGKEVYLVKVPSKISINDLNGKPLRLKCKHHKNLVCDSNLDDNEFETDFHSFKCCPVESTNSFSENHFRIMTRNESNIQLNEAKICGYISIRKSLTNHCEKLKPLEKSKRLVSVEHILEIASKKKEEVSDNKHEKVKSKHKRLSQRDKERDRSSPEVQILDTTESRSKKKQKKRVESEIEITAEVKAKKRKRKEDEESQCLDVTDETEIIYEKPKKKRKKHSEVI